MAQPRTVGIVKAEMAVAFRARDFKALTSLMWEARYDAACTAFAAQLFEQHEGCTRSRAERDAFSQSAATAGTLDVLLEALDYYHLDDHVRQSNVEVPFVLEALNLHRSVVRVVERGCGILTVACQPLQGSQRAYSLGALDALARVLRDAVTMRTTLHACQACSRITVHHAHVRELAASRLPAWSSERRARRHRC